MTWNGLGVFEPPGTPEFPAIANDLIRAGYYNTVIQALCDGFRNTVPRDGQAPFTGDLDAGGFSIKNLALPTRATDAVRQQEFLALQAQVNAISVPVEPFVYLNQGIY